MEGDKNISGKDLSILTEELKTQLLGFKSFPYKSKLSFLPLLQRMREVNNFVDSGIQKNKEDLLAEIEKYPELLKPADDFSLVKKHEQVIQLLMTFIFPIASQNTDLGRAMPPFSLDSFFVTPGLHNLLYKEKMNLSLERSMYHDPVMTIIQAGLRILSLQYGFNINFDTPFIFSAKIGRIKRFFKTTSNVDFVTLHLKGEPPVVTEKTFNHLIKNLYDTKLWLDTLPPEIFEFHGMVHARLIDVTHEEALSRIKHKLLEREGVLKQENIEELQELLRIFFEIPDLVFGITAIDYPLKDAVDHKYKIRYDILADEVEQLLDPKYKNSIYERACKYRSEVIIEDLESQAFKTELETKLLEKGIKSILLIPIINSFGKVIGLLEFGHHLAFGFNYFHRLYLEEIIELFNVAVERSRNDVDNRIEAIIREKYTAIHPSVEWKFIQAAYDYMINSYENQQAEIDEIVLSNVYPLYGQVDVVNSSILRNAAINKDIKANLILIKDLFESASKNVVFPLTDKYILDLENEINLLNSDGNTIDESKLVHYIHYDLHPLLLELKEFSQEISTEVDKYFNKLDPRLHLIYNKRKDFETSINTLNNELSSHLEEAQIEAQKMIPHYFERYKTDGIEYDMYVGQSILNHGKFDQLHLKNLRLWQLINMCELTKLSSKTGKTLPVPMQTAQLIFVYDSDISIRFRSDEKQFDIDGAYNVRYEIIKSRIDKSKVVETGRRLTLPGKISIVFTTEETRTEYKDYLNYLSTSNYIESEIEELEIKALKGVIGLHALRVKVKGLTMGRKNLKIA